MGNDRPAQFFISAYTNFLSAAAKEECCFFYQLMGFTFSIRFASRVIAEKLKSAFSHLRVQNGEHSDLTICVWDNVSTNTSPLTLPWDETAKQYRGEVPEYSDEKILTLSDLHTKVLHVMDRERKMALYWIRDQSHLPWWVGGSPLQHILHWWMRTHRHQLTHVAAVGYAKGGVLLAGKGGSGKSTTTLACMKAGMQYIGEDYCSISDIPNVWVHSVYSSAKLSEKTLFWFAELKKEIANPNRSPAEKALIFHHQFQPEKILLSCPVKALIALNIEEREKSFLEPIDPKEALAPLSITTLWQLPHTGPDSFNHLKRIAYALPCFKLHLGNDWMQTPKIIAGLL